MRLFKTLGFLIILILSVSSVSAVSPIACYSFDNVYTDTMGNYEDFNNVNAVYTASGKLSGAFSYSASQARMNLDSVSFSTDKKIFMGFMKMNGAPGSKYNNMIVGTYNHTEAASYGWALGMDTDGTMTLWGDQGGDYYDSGVVVSDDAFHHFAVVKDGTDFDLYVDGTLRLTNQSITYGDGNNRFVIGIRADAASLDQYDGLVDELIIYNATGENQTKIIEDNYNSGSGVACADYTAPASEESSLVVTEGYNATSLENLTLSYNLSIEWYNYNVTDTDAVLYYDGVYYEATLDEYSYNYDNGSTNYSVSIPTSLVTYNSSDVILEWFYNVTINSTKTNYSKGAHNQTIYYDYPRVNITAINGFSSQNITNFTGNITATGYYETFNVTTGTALIRLSDVLLNYTVYVESPEYAIANETNYQTLEITDSDNLTIRELQFSLYSSNSVFIYVRDETDNSLIIGTTTITVSSNATEEIYNTTNGTIYITNLTDGIYNFKFNSGNYSERTYSVTVADRSYQTLNAYLSPSTDEVTFTIKDYDTGETLEGASITMSRLINSSWVVVESKYSDITGRARFIYTNSIKYRFYVTLNNYVSKTFDLDPVIFDSYDVRINKVTSQNYTLDYTGVSISFTPKRFYNNAENNLTFYFDSPDGLFETYSYNIVYPGGETSDSGVNAIGEVFLSNFSIVNAGLFDTVNITITYDITTSTEKTYNYLYTIQGAVSLGNNTYVDNLGEDYGLGVFERLLIAILVMLLVGGVITSLAGAIPGLIMSLLVLGIFTVLGFVPIWVLLITGLGGFILMIKYS